MLIRIGSPVGFFVPSFYSAVYFSSLYPKDRCNSITPVLPPSRYIENVLEAQLNVLHVIGNQALRLSLHLPALAFYRGYP